MPDDQNPKSVWKKAGLLLSHAITYLSGVFSSVVKFTKASILSLIIIVIVLLLLTKMDQAFTMFVDLIEVKGIKWGLFFSFFMINALALALSHYPIYNYYAANLNNSSKFTIWEELYPFKGTWPKFPLKLYKFFKVFIFHEKTGGTYKKDDRAHYLRYSIGLLIHAVWIFFIIKTFLPKFNLTEAQATTTIWIFWALCFVPLLHYIFLRKAVVKAKKDFNTTRIYKKLAYRFSLLLTITIILVIICLVYDALFSRGGFFILVLTCYLFMLNYLYFRLLRTKLADITDILKQSGFKPVLWGMQLLKYLFYRSEHYLLLFSFNFMFSITIIIWTTIMALEVGDLPNGTPILLAFFYAYYFIIAAIGKFFFAYNKIREQKSKKNTLPDGHSVRFKILCVSLFLILLLFIIGMFTETHTHELDLVDRNNKEDITQDEFLTAVSKMDGSSVFFIASHGGGLKSNAWTLHVLEKLHAETNGKLMDNTVALSGASGGSLGLALYTGLSKELTGNLSSDMKLLNSRIDNISEGNYTSSDLAFTFGLDSFRKLWLLNGDYSLRDRPYYAMMKYQNYVEDNRLMQLSKQPFRSFWKDVYKKHGYFPSLIMNTASTTGRRGILWSVKANKFDNIFHFSEDLAELEAYNGNGNKTIPKTLSYYEAVSTTNRFPVFSPAAKIPGYGHYIDAGAIDNSGMLGCLDLYLYLQAQNNFTFFQNKKVVFIEIINSKTLYLDDLLKRIEKNRIEKDENETDNIIADLQTALNLDKIPGYVSDFVDGYSQIELIKIFMPHKVTIGDVEGYLNGDIKNKSQRNELNQKLIAHNNYLDSITEAGHGSGDRNKFFKKWRTYEPTLSRHLSESSLQFIEDVLEHEDITRKIQKIKTLVGE